MRTISFTKKAAEDLAKAYSTADMVAQREATLKLIDLQPGEKVIDVGCGPGFLCEAMAEHVGPAGKVQGIDISPDLIELCQSRTPPAHLTYAVGDALNISAEDANLDVAVCTQVAEYIPDTQTVLSEIFRVLCPGGRALIMATDWDCVACFSESPERMKRVLRAWEGHCAHPRLPRVLRQLLADQGFESIKAAMHPLVNLRFDPNTYSYGIIKLMREFVPTAGLSEETADAWLNELTRLDQAGRFYFTSARMIFTAGKPA